MKALAPAHEAAGIGPTAQTQTRQVAFEARSRKIIDEILYRLDQVASPDELDEVVVSSLTGDPNVDRIVAARLHVFLLLQRSTENWND